MGVMWKDIPVISNFLRAESGQGLYRCGRRWNNTIASFRAYSNISSCIAQTPTFCMGHGVEREAKTKSKERVRSDDHYMEF